MNREISVVPSEQKRTLRAITFVDLWNLLRGAKGALGPTAQTFSWHEFASKLRRASSIAVSPGADWTEKIDQIHLLDEGVYIYGAPTPHGTGPGSEPWLHDLASESGFSVKEETTKPEKYRCQKCGSRIKIHRESGSDAHLISDLLWLAWQDRYDVAIVVSGDTDLIPSIERIQLSGRKVVAALFDRTSLKTRRTAHATVSLDSLLTHPDVYPSEVGAAAIFYGLPAQMRMGNTLFPLVLRHGHEPLVLRELFLNSLEDYLGKNWFKPDKRSELPEGEQRKAKLGEYRDTIKSLFT